MPVPAEGARQQLQHQPRPRAARHSRRDDPGCAQLDTHGESQQEFVTDESANLRMTLVTLWHYLDIKYYSF